jgi:hypothetical protein
LDYRKINKVVNKLFVAGFTCDSSKGYNKEFYRAIGKINVTKELTMLIKQVKDLPILNGRYQIFVELRKLFNTQRWYGFYSLALPQIEGIFAEMIQASKPSGKVTGALTDKVQQVRPFYSSSERSFDYYEYHLPNERNLFSHTGRVFDVKRKCKILLLDLIAIVNIFSELESPLLGLKKIIDGGVITITDIGRLSNFIHLVEQTKNDGLFANIKVKCDGFVYNSLLKQIDFPSFFRNLEQDFQAGFKRYRDHVHSFSSIFNGHPVDVDTIRNKDLAENLTILQALHDEHSFMFEENLKLLLDTHYVIQTFAKMFPDCGDDLKKLLTHFFACFKDQMKTIKVLDEKLKVKIPEDFLLTRKDLAHYLGTQTY